MTASSYAGDAKTLAATSQNILISHAVTKTGWYLVVGDARIVSAITGNFNLMICNVSSASDYVETWNWASGINDGAGYTHVQAVGIFHAAAGTYINLCAYAGPVITLGGTRMTVLRIRT